MSGFWREIHGFFNHPAAKTKPGYSIQIPLVSPMAIEEFDPYPGSGFSHRWGFDQSMKKGAPSKTKHLF
jgi:hypothetical protein